MPPGTVEDASAPPGVIAPIEASHPHTPASVFPPTHIPAFLIQKGARGHVVAPRGGRRHERGRNPIRSAAPCRPPHGPPSIWPLRLDAASEAADGAAARHGERQAPSESGLLRIPIPAACRRAAPPAAAPSGRAGAPRRSGSRTLEVVGLRHRGAEQHPFEQKRCSPCWISFPIKQVIFPLLFRQAKSGWRKGRQGTRLYKERYRLARNSFWRWRVDSGDTPSSSPPSSTPAI